MRAKQKTTQTPEKNRQRKEIEMKYTYRQTHTHIHTCIDLVAMAVVGVIPRFRSNWNMCRKKSNKKGHKI